MKKGDDLTNTGNETFGQRIEAVIVLGGAGFDTAIEFVGNFDGDQRLRKITRLATAQKLLASLLSYFDPTGKTKVRFDYDDRRGRIHQVSQRACRASLQAINYMSGGDKRLQQLATIEVAMRLLNLAGYDHTVGRMMIFYGDPKIAEITAGFNERQCVALGSAIYLINMLINRIGQSGMIWGESIFDCKTHSKVLLACSLMIKGAVGLEGKRYDVALVSAATILTNKVFEELLQDNGSVLAAKQTAAA